MATVAYVVANPIFSRNPHPKFSAAKLSATANSRYASTSVSSSAPKFNVKPKSCIFFSAAKNNQYSKLLRSRHTSLCMAPPNATKDHLGIGQPLGRVGGKWSTAYPYNPRSHNPTEDASIMMADGLMSCVVSAGMVCCLDLPVLANVVNMALAAVLAIWLVWRCGEASVIKLQVGFSGKGRELGFVLNQIAETADTSRYEGLSYVLKETSIALLRHLEYNNISSISVVSVFGRHEANHHIDQLSFEERVKNKETLVNVSNMKLQSPASQKSPDDRYSDDIMVTLFVGLNDRAKLSTVNNKYELEKVLHELRSFGASNKLTAVETLWTPQVSSCLPALSARPFLKFLSDEGCRLQTCTPKRVNEIFGACERCENVLSFCSSPNL